MGSITSTSSSLALLAQTLTKDNKTSAQNLSKVLATASPSDAVELSSATVALQQASGLFGQSQSNNTPLPIPGATPDLNLPSGVSAGDINNATASQKQAIADQAVALQQVQGLFQEASPTTGSLNVMA